MVTLSPNMVIDRMGDEEMSNVVTSGDGSSPPPSVVGMSRVLRRGTGTVDRSLKVDQLPTEHYTDLIGAVDKQMAKTIAKSILLQKRKAFMEKLILIESLAFIVFNSTSTMLGTSQLEAEVKVPLLYVNFTLGLATGLSSILIKWLKKKHETDIENYRSSVKEIVNKYGNDAFYIMERRRLSLPADVLAAGFFRGIGEKDVNETSLHRPTISISTS